ncbi:MAG: outer membrane protein OmpA-like peptidoglycan-associated protein [Verrucomicrobiales bacterium]|jgi:outer membrane protein OmpA-like peptidoglycan-associated protein
MSSVTRILIIVLVLSGLFVGIGSLRKGQIEGALTLKSTAALIRAVPELRNEADWKVSFVGTEGIVHGRIESRLLLEKIERAIDKIERAEIAGLEAVGNLYNGLQFKEPASLSVSTLRSGSVRVEGKLTASLIDQLRPAIAKALPEHAAIDDYLEVRRELNEIYWGDELIGYLPEFLREGEGCRLMIEDNRVILGGIVLNQAKKESLGALTVSHLGNVFSVFENRLGIAADRKPAFMTVYFVAPDSLRLSGALPSAAVKQAFLSHLKSVVPSNCRISDEIQVDGTLSESSWYDRLPDVTPKLFQYAMTGKLEIEGDTVRAHVDAVSDRGRKEIEQVIGSLFPVGDFQLSSNVQVKNGGAMHAEAAVVKPMPAARKIPVSIPALRESRRDPVLRQLVEDTIIYFKINSAMLGDKNISTLRKVGKALAASPTHGVLLRGFTDSGGNAKMNRELAQLRCRSVRKLLMLGGAIDAQIRVEPWSESLVLSDADEPIWKKRRVKMHLEGSPASKPLATSYELRRADLVSAPIATKEVELAQQEALQKSIVYFGMNSYALRRSERSKLRKALGILLNHPDKVVVISGFCDRWGNVEYNQFLSRKRCETVKSYMIGLGMAGAKLVIEENGNSIAESEEGPSWKKRRVEFRLRDRQQMGAL